MDDSDEALMARVARGDEPAFRLLCAPPSAGHGRARPPHPRQRRRRRGRGAGSHAARLDPRAALAAAGAFRTWLTRVVVNLCLDRKRRAPWVELEAAGDIVDPAPGASEQAEHDERDRMVAAAIAELPERQRAAIVLTYGEGMSNAQVAEILDTSVSAVETLLVRGKQNLRRALGERDRRGRVK